VFSGVSIPQEVDGEREKVSEDNTMIDVETLFEAILNMSMRFTSFINEPLSGKKQDFHFWYYCYQVLDNEDFQIIRRQIKEFCSMYGIVFKWYHFADWSSTMVVPASSATSGYVLVRY